MMQELSIIIIVLYLRLLNYDMLLLLLSVKVLLVLNQNFEFLEHKKNILSHVMHSGHYHSLLSMLLESITNLPYH